MEDAIREGGDKAILAELSDSDKKAIQTYLDGIINLKGFVSAAKRGEDENATTPLLTQPTPSPPNNFEAYLPEASGKRAESYSGGSGEQSSQLIHFGNVPASASSRPEDQAAWMTKATTVMSGPTSPAVYIVMPSPPPLSQDPELAGVKAYGEFDTDAQRPPRGACWRRVLVVIGLVVALSTPIVGASVLTYFMFTDPSDPTTSRVYTTLDLIQGGVICVGFLYTIISDFREGLRRLAALKIVTILATGLLAILNRTTLPSDNAFPPTIERFVERTRLTLLVLVNLLWMLTLFSVAVTFKQTLDRARRERAN